jgi:hypothetical protein
VVGDWASPADVRLNCPPKLPIVSQPPTVENFQV